MKITFAVVLLILLYCQELHSARLPWRTLPAFEDNKEDVKHIWRVKRTNARIEECETGSSRKFIYKTICEEILMKIRICRVIKVIMMRQNCF